MGKNKNGKKSQGSDLTEQFKVGTNEVIEGLGFDPSQDARHKVDNSRKEDPSLRISGELEEQIIEERKEMLKKGLFEDFPALRDQLKQIKPDIQASVDENGNETAAKYTKDAFDKKEGLKKQFNDLKKALHDAYVNGNYKLLIEYYKGSK